MLRGLELHKRFLCPLGVRARSQPPEDGKRCRESLLCLLPPLCAAVQTTQRIERAALGVGIPQAPCECDSLVTGMLGLFQPILALHPQYRAVRPQQVYQREQMLLRGCPLDALG